MVTEFKQLLDREKNIGCVEKTFHNHIKALKDIVNYGSWLIPRAFDSSKKGWTEIVIICVLVKQVVMMIDSIEVLISNAIALPGLLQGRAAFEASLYIDWILKDDSENRAKHYYVSGLRNKRYWDLRTIKGTEQEKLFSDDITKLEEYVNYDNKDVQEIANKELVDIDRVLAQKDLKHINEEFERLYQKNNIERNWYIPIIKKGYLKTMAKEVGRTPEYIFFYETGSRVAHASSYTDHIKISKGNKIVFEPIRNLSEINLLITQAMKIAMHTYRIIVKKYRPGEQSNLVNKYKSDWREYFLNIPSVNYVQKK